MWRIEGRLPMGLALRLAKFFHTSAHTMTAVGHQVSEDLGWCGHQSFCQCIGLYLFFRH